MCSLRARKVPACARALANKYTFKENKIQNYTLDTGFPSRPRSRRPSERGVRPPSVDSGSSVADEAAVFNDACVAAIAASDFPPDPTLKRPPGWLPSYPTEKDRGDKRACDTSGRSGGGSSTAVLPVPHSSVESSALGGSSGAGGVAAS